jgi:hypothetical protein
MKKTLLALAVGATAFGSIYGLAASLGVSSDTLGEGSTAVAACQATTSPVNVKYTPAYTATGYQTTSITLTGLLPSCDNKSVFVTLTGTNGLSTSPVSVTGNTGTSGGTLTITAAAPAADVTGVRVAITG